MTAPAGRPESLWRIAEWFTGDGGVSRDPRGRARSRRSRPRRDRSSGSRRRCCLPIFRSEAAAPAAPPESPLEFGTDADGRYAVYRLQRGEALYSAVVVRFTGRVHAEDVNEKASEIACAAASPTSGRFPWDFPVKIPVDGPRARVPAAADDPQRIEEEAARLEAGQFVNRVRAADLSGVTFVLDAGHGGRDTGAIVEGIEEAQPVYDLACRVESLLETHTRAKVVRTVRGDRPCSSRRSDGWSDWKTARVLTTPPYDLEDAVAGVNFRWYLANAVLRGVQKSGGSTDRTVFLSLHADSLHPAVRGLMVYIPGEKFLRGTYGKSGEPYASRREFREAPRVSFSRRERMEAEGMSLDFAEKIVAAFRSAGLPLHDFQPIRRNVIRSGQEWVPAILRYNRIPTRVLVEVCNLNNADDRKLLMSSAFRDRVARAIVSALVDYYGGDGRETVTASLAR